MTDRVEFLYLRKEFTETLSEKWAMYLTQQEESQAPSSGSTPATPPTPAKMSRKRTVDEMKAPSSAKSVTALELHSQHNSFSFENLLSLDKTKHFS